MPDTEQTQQLLQTALGHHQNGAFPEAAKLYREILRQEPDNFSATYLFGTLMLQSGKAGEAVDLLRRATRMNPQHASAHNTLGLACQEFGVYEEARHAFEAAIEIDPGYTHALNNLAILLKVFNKDEEAIELFRRVLAQEPGDLEAAYNLGLALQSTGKGREAIEQYRSVISRDEKHYLAWNNLGVLLLNEKLYFQAEEALNRALSIERGYAEAWFNLGNVCKGREEFSQALKHYRQALELKPNLDAALTGMGDVYYQQSLFDEAVSFFEKALEVNPESSDAFYNYGLAVQELGRSEEALHYFTKALTLDETNAPAEFSKADMLLLLGKVKEGFRHYEARLDFTLYRGRKYKEPKWDGQPLVGKRILVFDEQGAGDLFMFSRYLHELKKLGAHVIFECRRDALSLMRDQVYVDEIHELDRVEIPLKFDYYSPLISLPAAFKTDSGSIPRELPNIRVSEKKQEQWHPKVKRLKKGKVGVGIAWTGNPKPRVNRKRHMTLDQLRPLFAVDTCRFFSLQVGNTTPKVKKYAEEGLLVDLTPEIKDYYDTAALINELDIIITIDTSIAHLAGALGINCRTMLTKYPDWRWGLEGDTTPWYSGMKLYRQEERGNWKPVIERVAVDLRKDTEAPKSERDLFLALTSGQNFGWAVCSDYLKKHISEERKITILDEMEEKPPKVEGIVVHALTGADLKRLHQVEGDVNIGYTFFENELPPEAAQNAAGYDLVLGGSTWCRDRLEEKGIHHNGTLIQGIDPEIFFPITEDVEKNSFVVFSGGKFEYRKGQDLVLKAMKIFMEKHSDVLLINSWYNLWPASMKAMAASPFIKFDLVGDDYEAWMTNLYKMNGINPERVFTLPLMPNKELRSIYAQSDVGLFPNRCEGGTNLVLMEYMACSKPVIASYNTGHKDVLTKDNALLLEKMKRLALHDRNKKLVARWEEPDLEEILAKLEFAYIHRERLRETGRKGGEAMKEFTWKKTADTLLGIISEYE